MRTRFMVIGLMLLSCLSVFADDGSVGTVGGNITILNDHPSVRMVREDVYIKTMNLRRTEGYIDKRAIEVRCRFVFRNEGDPCTVKMGFPEDFGGEFSGFRYFRSKVDGKSISVRKVLPVGSEGRGWRVKSVHFNRNQTRIVEDTYGGSMGGSIGWVSTLTYILTTGRSWRGPIGEAVITVDISAMKDYQTIIPNPSGYRRRGNILTWRFMSFEPQKEINVLFWPGYSKFVVNGEDGSLIGYGIGGKERMPYLERGLVVAPLEYAGYLLHEKVEPLDGSSKDFGSAVLRIGGKVVRIAPGERKAVVDGKTITLPRAPYVRTSKSTPPRRVLVAPIASILRALGAEVTFDRRSGITYITKASGH